MALLAGIGPRSRSHKLYRRVDDMSWPEKGHAKIPFAGLEAGHAKLSRASEVRSVKSQTNSPPLAVGRRNGASPWHGHLATGSVAHQRGSLAIL